MVQPATTGIDRDRWPYRMKDLCTQTGLGRQAIHFYIREGLLPPGHKTGRNMAFYGPEHLTRLELIMQLQHERFLPLKAIRALVNEEEDHFAQTQRDWLVALRRRFMGTLGGAGGPETALLVASVKAHTGVDPSDVHRMVALGLLTLQETDDGPEIPAGDVWLVELWGEVCGLDIPEKLGFQVEDLALYAHTIEALVAQEAVFLSRRTAGRDPAETGALIEQSLPLIHRFLSRHHTTLLRRFFDSL